MNRINRKNVTKACEECRVRRTRCDGETPSCGRCSTRRITCVYTSKDDGRRPASKSYVRMLRQRIADLESTLDAKSANEDVAADVAVDVESSALNLGVSQQEEASRFDSTMSGALSTDEALNFVQDGEARFFGATSGRLEFRRTNSSLQSHDTRAAAPYKASNQLSMLCQNILDENETSRELEDHLLELYFTWEQPFLQVVDEGLFKSSRETGGPYYSPLLLNSILWIASRYSDRCNVRSDRKDPNTAGRLFLEKADVLLYYELKWPSITTIQALVILTTAYCAFGEDAASWLHHGIASRLALDMGLNYDPLSVPETHQLPPEEVYLRRQVYWAVYCCDKLSASYTGRVCTFLSSQATMKLPSNTLQLPSSLNSITHRYPSSSSQARAFASLSQIIEKILLSLYAPQPCIRVDQRRDFFTSCSLCLKNWMYDNHGYLRLDKSKKQPAALYIIHMIYHTACILLAKPFFLFGQGNRSRKSRERDNEAANQDPTAQQARELSYRAALDICQVASNFRKVFGSFRRSPITATYCTLSAVLILLNAKSAQWPGQNEAAGTRDIELCLLVLEELGTSWSTADKIGQNVERLYEHIMGRETDGAVHAQQVTIGKRGANGEHVTRRPQEHRMPTEQYTRSVYDGSASRPARTVDTDHDPPTPTDLGQQHINMVNMLNEHWSPAILFAESNLHGSQDVFPSDYSSFDMLSRSHLESIW